MDASGSLSRGRGLAAVFRTARLEWRQSGPPAAAGQERWRRRRRRGWSSGITKTASSQRVSEHGGAAGGVTDAGLGAGLAAGTPAGTPWRRDLRLRAVSPLTGRFWNDTAGSSAPSNTLIGRFWVRAGKLTPEPRLSWGSGSSAPRCVVPEQQPLLAVSRAAHLNVYLLLAFC